MASKPTAISATAYLDRIKHAPSEAKEIQLEVNSRYDREEPEIAEVIKEVEKITGPLVTRSIEDIRKELAHAAGIRDFAVLDRELRARPDREEGEVLALRANIEDRVSAAVLQIFHTIGSEKGDWALEQIELEAFSRNGHPHREADICDLVDCPMFGQFLNQHEKERAARTEKASSSIAQIYYGRIDEVPDFKALKKVHKEITMEDRIPESEKAALLDAVNKKSVVFSIRVNHEQMARKETTEVLKAVELVAAAEPDLLLPENIEDLETTLPAFYTEMERVIRLRLGFGALAEKYPKISVFLVEQEEEYKKAIAEMFEKEKKADPTANLGDMKDYGNLPSVGRGKGLPDTPGQIYTKLVQYHSAKLANKAIQEAIAEQRRLEQEAKDRGEEYSPETVTFGGGPRTLTPAAPQNAPTGGAAPQGTTPASGSGTAPVAKTPKV